MPNPTLEEKVRRTFANRLKAARKAAGYRSAEALAKALGVEPHAYRAWEAGRASPRLDMLERLCPLLAVTPNYLLPLALRRTPPAGGVTERKPVVRDWLVIDEKAPPITEVTSLIGAVAPCQDEAPRARR